MIDLSTDPGDHVLDPFAGRETTGLFFKQIGSRFTGIELYDYHVKIAKSNTSIKKINEKIFKITFRGGYYSMEDLLNLNPILIMFKVPM